MSRTGYTPEKIIVKLRGAEVLVERWRRENNQVRPHSTLGYPLFAPEAIETWWSLRLLHVPLLIETADEKESPDCKQT